MIVLLVSSCSTVRDGSDTPRFTYENRDRSLEAFTPSGPFVLYQASLETLMANLPLTAEQAVSNALVSQQKLLTGFVPTPADQLASLPVDPSGRLYARTLDSPSGTIPALKGVWSVMAWLHFEPDPLAAAARFADAGVDWVVQLLATLYQTRNPDASALLDKASALLDKKVTVLRDDPSATAAGPVTGLPQASCFHRAQASALPPEPPPTWQRVDWRFKCAASVDRYVFTVYGFDPKDTKERLAAQYRILASR